ncbi:hypothetical protein G7046_g1511 [Stylonectria norvegica]|nr:hypothetical protein G7046_g1511 [Stylonectria norvegica]
MVSTVNSRNGFRLELLPIALSASSTSACTSGLLNAILAVAAFHWHGSEAALPYKSKAIRHLSDSLSKESADDSVTIDIQLATSMMLCVYSVFDEAEGYWHLHLNGARVLFQRAAGFKGGRLDPSFLYTWFLYHDVLSAFSQSPRRQPVKPSSLELIKSTRSDNTTIIGSLGCSVEVMELIHHVNELRQLPEHESRENSLLQAGTEAQHAKSLELRLLNLSQSMDSRDLAHHSSKERTRIMTTAELYRIATLLYLWRASPHLSSSEYRTIHLEQAFELLGSLEVCTSPWPLFVIACETEIDAQRITILRALDCMDEARKIGNVFVLRTIIESFWKQQDLQADTEKAKQVKWWELVTFDTAAPWFI